ncbi:hypothetical protein BV25DRAFT_1912440 [Artomyces pyxidatus]|uniref:Uncharacterized protein n=1 Tax=Artomyces pyxidatus TaxID=48021 RepID=A0ACB8TFD0_9AGAM|nr:hypothetical protein BV25DRAFT_1912440 [Artomyces pyxidatus]
MSFITVEDGTGLVRSRWPGNVALGNELPSDYVLDMAWQRCPCTLEDLRKWAYFTHNPDPDERRREPFSFVYKPGPTALFPSGLVPEQVELRIQGFVQQVELSPIGSWNSHADDVSSATKYIVLNGGRFHGIFHHQVLAINAIGELGRQSLCPRANKSCYSPMTEFGLISFRRPASAKKIESVLDGTLDMQDIDAEVDDDESSDGDELEVQVRKLDGTLVEATWHAIRVSDFVEVKAKVKVHWSLTNGSGEGCGGENAKYKESADKLDM